MILLTPKQVTITLDMPVIEPVLVPRPGRPWTIADLLARSSEEARYELVRGDLLMMSPASPVQGRYAARLTGALTRYLDEHDLGEAYTAEPGFVLQPEPDSIVRAPDVAFVRKDRIPSAEDESGFWPIAPDLAVEVISPSESATAVQDKVQDYLQAGTEMIWLVYPTQKIVIEYQAGGQVRQFGIGDYLEGGAMLPGFRYALRQLFRER